MSQLNHTLLVSYTELYIIKHAFVHCPKFVINSVVKWLSLNEPWERGGAGNSLRYSKPNMYSC